MNKPEELLAVLSHASNIKRFGFSIHSTNDHVGNPFVYTLGLNEVTNEADLVISGMPADIAIRVLRILAAQVRNGTVFTDGQIIEAGEKLRFAMQKIPTVPLYWESHFEIAMMAATFAGWRHKLPAMTQVILSDVDGKFPWEEGCVLTGVEPLLAERVATVMREQKVAATAQTTHAN